METLKKLLGLNQPTLKELLESYSPKVELKEQKTPLLPYMGAVEKLKIRKPFEHFFN